MTGIAFDNNPTLDFSDSFVSPLDIQFDGQGGVESFSIATASLDAADTASLSTPGCDTILMAVLAATVPAVAISTELGAESEGGRAQFPKKLGGGFATRTAVCDITVLSPQVQGN